MGTGDCAIGEGDTIVDLDGEVNPGVGEVNCDPLLEFIPWDEIILGVGDARMFMAGDDIFRWAWELIAGAGEAAMLRGAGLEFLELGLM